MDIFETTEKIVEETVDIVCDKCGRSCMGAYGNFCGIRLAFSGGPDSPIFPDDEQTHSYDICEFCADEWLKTWCKGYVELVTGVLR